MAQSDTVLKEQTSPLAHFSAAISVESHWLRPWKTLEEERLLQGRFSETGPSRVIPCCRASAACLPLVVLSQRLPGRPLLTDHLLSISGGCASNFDVGNLTCMASLLPQGGVSRQFCHVAPNGATSLHQVAMLTPLWRDQVSHGQGCWLLLTAAFNYYQSSPDFLQAILSSHQTH